VDCANNISSITVLYIQLDTLLSPPLLWSMAARAVHSGRGPRLPRLPVLPAVTAAGVLAMTATQRECTPRWAGPPER